MGYLNLKSLLLFLRIPHFNLLYIWTLVSSKLLSNEQQILDDDLKNHLRDPMMHDFKVKLLKEIEDTKWMLSK